MGLCLRSLGLIVQTMAVQVVRRRVVLAVRIDHTSVRRPSSCGQRQGRRDGFGGRICRWGPSFRVHDPAGASLARTPGPSLVLTWRLRKRREAEEDECDRVIDSAEALRHGRGLLVHRRSGRHKRRVEADCRGSRVEEGDRR